MPPATATPRYAPPAFTLVEMLVVMGIIVVLMALIVPAFTKIGSAQNLTAGAYAITGALETARAYAKANNTYTWVGFFEENYNSTTGAGGEGRVILSTVASKDGTAMVPAAQTPNNPFDPGKLVQVGKLAKVDNADLYSVADNPGAAPFPSLPSPTPPPLYQVGADQFSNRPDGTANRTTFAYPLGAATPTYTFNKIIQFNPLGDATKIADSPQRLMEIDVQPTHGSTPDNAAGNRLAIQIAGIGGQVRLYRP